MELELGVEEWQPWTGPAEVGSRKYTGSPCDAQGRRISTRVTRKNRRAEWTEEEGRRGRNGRELADIGSLKISIGEALPIPVCGPRRERLGAARRQEVSWSWS